MFLQVWYNVKESRFQKHERRFKTLQRWRTSSISITTTWRSQGIGAWRRDNLHDDRMFHNLEFPSGIQESKLVHWRVNSNQVYHSLSRSWIREDQPSSSHWKNRIMLSIKRYHPRHQHSFMMIYQVYKCELRWRPCHHSTNQEVPHQHV